MPCKSGSGIASVVGSKRIATSRKALAIVNVINPVRTLPESVALPILPDFTDTGIVCGCWRFPAVHSEAGKRDTVLRGPQNSPRLASRLFTLASAKMHEEGIATSEENARWQVCPKFFSDLFLSIQHEKHRLTARKLVTLPTILPVSSVRSLETGCVLL